MRWMRGRHADHPSQGEAGCAAVLQRKLAGARQLGTKNLNLGLTTTMNELLIGFGVTSAGFGPLASASGLGCATAAPAGELLRRWPGCGPPDPSQLRLVEGQPARPRSKAASIMIVSVSRDPGET